MFYYPNPFIPPSTGLVNADLRIDNRIQTYAGSFFGSSSINQTFPNGGNAAAAESDLLLVSVVSPVAGTFTGVDYTIVHENLALGSSFATLAYRVDPGDEPTSPWSYGFGASVNNWHWAEREAERTGSSGGLVSGITDVATSVNATSFPTVSIPGDDWLIFYIVQFGMSVGASPSVNGGDSITGSSYSMDPTITEHPLNSAYPEIHVHGETSWGYELAPYGTATPRTFTASNTTDYVLTTISANAIF